MIALSAALTALVEGPLHAFDAFPTALIPESPGVYSIWRAEQYLYVGMAGRSEGQKKGLRGRLLSHGSGRRSGDQFCIYVCDRLVLATLNAAVLAEVAAGKTSLDDLTKTFIRRELRFRIAMCASPNEARELENAAKAGLPGTGPPLLNPAPIRASGMREKVRP